MSLEDREQLIWEPLVGFSGVQGVGQGFWSPGLGRAALLAVRALVDRWHHPVESGPCGDYSPQGFHHKGG